MTILDEQNNTTETVAITDIVYGDYVTAVSAVFDLKESRFYSLTLLNGSEVMFKDKVFCTDKPIVNFSVNDGKYISNATTNTFIVYE